MAFSSEVDLTDPNNAGGASDNVLVEDMQKALGIWSQYVSGLGTLTVDLNIQQTSVGREDGGPTSEVAAGVATNGVQLYEPSSLYELTTGQHVAGTTSDITVDVSPGYFQYLDLDPNLSYDSQVPSNLYNPIVEFLHEIMHGFGMSGYYNADGTHPANYETTFDQYITTTSSGTAYFTGPNAEAAYGGPIELTTSNPQENYYHFGNTTSDVYRTPQTVQDPLTLELMNGIVFFFDYPYKISPVDLGVLRDLGYDVDGSTSAPAVSFDPNASFSNGRTPTLTGDVTSAFAGVGVEIYDGDPSNGGQDLGAATVNGDGTWSFTQTLAGGTHALTAVATDGLGDTAEASSPYQLVTGITGEPYRAQELDYAADGGLSGYTDFAKNGAPLVQATDNGDGTHTITGLVEGQKLQSIFNDVMTGNAVGDSFVFVPHFGKDEITDFVVAGPHHDTIDLTNTEFTNVAQLLQHTTMSQGNAVIHFGPRNTVTVDGITKSELGAHRADFALA